MAEIRERLNVLATMLAGAAEDALMILDHAKNNGDVNRAALARVVCRLTTVQIADLLWRFEEHEIEIPPPLSDMRARLAQLGF